MKSFYLTLLAFTFSVLCHAQTPIVYYQLNGNANDAGPNGLNGTINGTVTAVADRLGNANGAMSFPGNASSHISIADQPLLRPSSITLGAWVKITTPTSPINFINKSLMNFRNSTIILNY